MRNEKKRKSLINFCVSALISGFIFLDALSIAGGIDMIQVLKISPQDQRAVIKTADGKMEIIKVGEVIDSRQETVGSRQAVELKVVEITKDRVVFEEKKGDAIEKIIIRLVDGKQKIERMRKTGEKTPLLYAPQTMQTPTGDDKGLKTKKGEGKKSSFN